MRSINSILGLSFSVFGALFAIFNYFITYSAPLISTGLAIMIIGIALSLIPDSSITQRTLKSMLHSSMLNIEAILEHFDIKNSAVYVPTKDKNVVAYIPIYTNPHTPSIESYYNAPKSILTRLGDTPAIMILPPASEITQSEEISREASLEESLNYIICELCELSDSVKLVEKGDEIILEFKNIKFMPEAARFKLCLGSLHSSIAACVIAIEKERAVSIIEDNGDLRKNIVKMKLY
ncbi:MAG TPA: hypothetical protein VKU94_06505 [Geobacterales bacterium]|nr:hypothetical protein [Geobacterales bacterium]